jgi:hypothetical protein
MRVGCIFRVTISAKVSLATFFAKESGELILHLLNERKKDLHMDYTQLIPPAL